VGTDAHPRLRGFLRAPGPDELIEIGRREHLALTPDEAQGYASFVAGILRQIDRLDELEPTRRPLRHLTRDPGRRPRPDEDPFNAFVRFCNVPGAPDGPLAGKRLGVKDNLAVAGVPLTNGSRTAPYTPSADAVVVERLLDAGCTVVGKLNLDDFSTSGTGESAFFGPPRNPVDSTRSAGGSSGGTGSAVASGAVDVGIGVDQGGSARIPASFCGVVSLKATHGLVPSHGLTHIDHTIDSVCPTAADVELCAAATDVMGGPDDRDPQWGRGAPTATRCVDAVGRGVEGLRIGVLTEGTSPGLCEPDVVEAFHRSCEVLEGAGASVQPVTVPLWSDAWAVELAFLCSAAWAMAQSEGVGWGHLGEVDEARAHGFSVVRRAEADDFPPFMKAWLLAGRYLHERYGSSPYARAVNLRRELRDQVDAALRECDLLVMPTTPHVAPTMLAGRSDDMELLARGTTMTANTAPTNLSGHPSLAVPNGVDRDGLPTSLQIVGRRGADAQTFQPAAVVQAAQTAPAAAGSVPR
jgi:amidase